MPHRLGANGIPLVEGCAAWLECRLIQTHSAGDHDILVGRSRHPEPTRKVRRGYIAQKYAALIEALYGEGGHVEVEAKVTYEDGRTGTIRADVRIHDVVAGQGAR